MGQLINGKWHDTWYDTHSDGGQFKRSPSKFLNWITTDGSSDFNAESGRYHLYVSLACPWAHRTLIFRELKQLTPHIGVSIVSPYLLNSGWELKSNFPKCEGDPLFGFEYLHQLYTNAQQDYSGRVTVPVLWDKTHNTIVSNESADIIRMFNSAFNEMTGNTDDYYPVELQADIDAINEIIYSKINNGVYKCGFATTQDAYNESINPLFNCLDELELRLSQQGPYLFGETLTEADWRLFTTLVRFDLVYVGHFKCNRQMIREYPALSAYLKRLYHYPGVAKTVDLDHIKTHYYVSHATINPTKIIPDGPDLTWLTENDV